MKNMRVILIEAAMVAGVLMAGLSVSEVAYAAQDAIAPQTADPRTDVKIESSIRVERTEEPVEGTLVTTLLDPAKVKVIPGDKLLFTNSYHNIGTNVVTGFVVNNQVHASVGFTEVLEDWALVSVDGGQNFGKLSELTVIDAENARQPAKASDVTHIRWVLASPIASGASGELHFRGIVK